MKWYVYIAVAQKTGHYYTGISPNPQKRVALHNEGRGSQMALLQGPFELKYISDPFPSKSTARTREIQIKKWSRLKKEHLINGTWN